MVRELNANANFRQRVSRQTQRVQNPTKAESSRTIARHFATHDVHASTAKRESARAHYSLSRMSKTNQSRSCATCVRPQPWGVLRVYVRDMRHWRELGERPIEEPLDEDEQTRARTPEMPKWRNGRRSGFKIRRPKGREGSTPSFGTARSLPRFEGALL